MGDTRQRVWADGEVYPLHGWMEPIQKVTAPGKTVDCVRCGSMMFGRYYELHQRDMPTSISVCATCAFVLQSMGAVVSEGQAHGMSDADQRAVMQADFRDPAQWRAAQFVLHLPNNKGTIVEGAVIDVEEDVYVQIVDFGGLWFWKGKFLDVYRSGDEAFNSFDEAAAHALKALLYWHDRL